MLTAQSGLRQSRASLDLTPGLSLSPKLSTLVLALVARWLPLWSSGSLEDAPPFEEFRRFLRSAAHCRIHEVPAVSRGRAGFVCPTQASARTQKRADPPPRLLLSPGEAEERAPKIGDGHADRSHATRVLPQPVTSSVERSRVLLLCPLGTRTQGAGRHRGRTASRKATSGKPPSRGSTSRRTRSGSKPCPPTIAHSQARQPQWRGMPPRSWTLDRLGLSDPAGRVWCPSAE